MLLEFVNYLCNTIMRELAEVDIRFCPLIFIRFFARQMEKEEVSRNSAAARLWAAALFFDSFSLSPY